MEPVEATARAHGEVFTRRWVVETILDLVGYTCDRDLADLVVIEPSCGSGAFVGVIVERLIASAQRFGRPLSDIKRSLLAVDLLPEHVAAARGVARRQLTAAGVGEAAAVDLATAWIQQADFLLDDLPESVDVVVGNPPYVRYDDLPPATAASYRQRWSTMRGRGDIYVGFLQRSLGLLKPGGKMGVICADRWMRNQYGADLRELISQNYSVDHVWSMHDVDAFETQVSAYPAITVVSAQSQQEALVVEATSDFGAEQSAELLAAIETGAPDLEGHGYKGHRMAEWFSTETWPTGSPARLALIEYLNARFLPLHDPARGTTVSIGIATGADKVFLTKDADAVEPDRLLPLAMRRDLMTGHFEWQGNYLVNPWQADGGLVDLSEYPKMKAYLSAHPQLRERFVAKKNPDSWHRTIDKVRAEIIDRPKLLLQDMKTTIHPVLEPGGWYPHHNLYYVVSDEWDMEVLGGLLLSRVAQAFIEAYCVRMRGGTLRFQAQYLKRIRVPDPAGVTEEVKSLLRQSFRSRDVMGATQAACRAYGIDAEEYDLV